MVWLVVSPWEMRVIGAFTDKADAMKHRDDNHVWDWECGSYIVSGCTICVLLGTVEAMGDIERSVKHVMKGQCGECMPEMCRMAGQLYKKQLRDGEVWVDEYVCNEVVVNAPLKIACDTVDVYVPLADNRHAPSTHVDIHDGQAGRAELG